MRKTLALLSLIAVCFLLFSQSIIAGSPWDAPAEHNWKTYTDTLTILNAANDTSQTYTIGNVVYIGGIYNLTKVGGDSCKGTIYGQVSNDLSSWITIDSLNCTKATTAAVKSVKNWSTTLCPFLYVRFIFSELIAATDTGAVGVDLLLKE
jgi:hypothetical protein